MEILPLALTLFVIMDPMGNVPVFLSVLEKVPAEQRQKVIVRELLIALAIMLVFLFAGKAILSSLGLTPEAVAIGGGLVLLIIAIRMIFPTANGVMGEDSDSDPLIVPLAVPLVAGPSVLATLILQAESSSNIVFVIASLLLAWTLSSLILYFSTNFYKILGSRGLKAIERLMGMILIIISVQMLLNGFKSFLG